VLFFLRALQQQMQRLAKKVELEKLILSPLPDLSLRILEQVRAHGRITVAEAVALTGVSRNTLKVHFRGLVDKNLLVLHGGGRGAWYALP
jgi:Fic family protein